MFSGVRWLIGGVRGFGHFLANLAGIVFPAVTGLIVQWSGAFTGACVLAGGTSEVTEEVGTLRPWPAR